MSLDLSFMIGVICISMDCWVLAGNFCALFQWKIAPCKFPTRPLPKADDLGEYVASESG